jgi:hypothetical protein
MADQNQDITGYEFIIPRDCNVYTDNIDGMNIKYKACENSLCPNRLGHKDIRCVWEGELKIELLINGQHMFLVDSDNKKQRYNHLQIGSQHYAIYGTGIKVIDGTLYLLVKRRKAKVYNVGQEFEVVKYNSASPYSLKVDHSPELKQINFRVEDGNSVPGGSVKWIYTYQADKPGLYWLADRRIRTGVPQDMTIPWNKEFVFIQ